MSRPFRSIAPDRRIRARLALGLVVLALSAIATASATQAQSARGEGAPPRLLMLPILVHSAEDPAYLRDGLSDMLAARFARIGALELVRGPADQRGTTDPAKARARARKAGADYVLYGSFTRFGKGASLDVQCAPTSEGSGQKPLREIFVHSGSIGEIIPDLDELAGKVSRFARGEMVEPSRSAAAGLGLSPAQIQRLVSRVEALEQAVQTLEGQADRSPAASDGTSGELR